MLFRIEFERETDGRWIASVPTLAGVHVYGATREEALSHVKALALRVVADELENGERDSRTLESVTFETQAA